MFDFNEDPYRKFIFYRSYSRWLEEEGRRETWKETVGRFMSFMEKKVGEKLTPEEYAEVEEAIYNHEAVPSMRLVWSAGKAADRTNVCAYNCSFTAPTRWQDFGEILYILTCGTGVGFSCEKKVVEQLPVIKPQQPRDGVVPTHIVPDSKEGWADSLVLGLQTWAKGEDVQFDYSEIRPKGARLKTMGGRASGPEPLVKLLEFTRQTMFNAQGRRLKPIEVHDIICMIGEIVVAGGVRRSAEISLSTLDDQEMRDAKVNKFWEKNPHRSMANNSAVYEEKPSEEVFWREWKALEESGTGERGIFNRGNLLKHMPARRLRKASIADLEYTGTNPCGEITLRDKQFCNLSEAIARKDDTLYDLHKKVRIATIIGTFQSSLTDFPYLSRTWKDNCEQERLLGVSITGQYDCPLLRNPDVLDVLKEYAIKVNEVYAEKLNINQSTSVTCVKPSGTVSQLTNTSAGMHPRFSEYYIRRVRVDAKDPLAELLIAEGVPHTAEVGHNKDNPNVWVFEFPIKSPEGSVTVDDIEAIEQLEYWKMLKTNWTEHNPSCTIYVEEGEWEAVGNWVWENWDIVGGLSFLPKNDHIYELAPYEPIDKKTYEELVEEMPKLDFTKLSEYEAEDQTKGSREFACVGGTCEI